MFISEIQDIVYEYEPRYRLLEWIDKNKLTGEYFKNLLENPCAINMIEEMINMYPNILDDDTGRYGYGDKWKYISCNRNALHILERNIDKIDWVKACSHLPIAFLEKYPKQMRKNMRCLSYNQSGGVLKYIKRNLGYFRRFDSLYMNPLAFHLLSKDAMSVKGRNYWVSMNPKAITFLRNNKHLIVWEWFLCNKNGIDMIEEELNKPINGVNRFKMKNDPEHKITPIGYTYRYLSKNVNAMDILKNKQHLIYWSWFASNEGIFKQIRYLDNIV